MEAYLTWGRPLICLLTMCVFVFLCDLICSELQIHSINFSLFTFSFQYIHSAGIIHRVSIQHFSCGKTFSISSFLLLLMVKYYGMVVLGQARCFLFQALRPYEDLICIPSRK